MKVCWLQGGRSSGRHLNHLGHGLAIADRSIQDRHFEGQEINLGEKKVVLWTILTVSESILMLSVAVLVVVWLGQHRVRDVAAGLEDGRVELDLEVLMLRTTHGEASPETVELSNGCSAVEFESRSAEAER